MGESYETKQSFNSWEKKSFYDTNSIIEEIGVTPK